MPDLYQVPGVNEKDDSGFYLFVLLTTWFDIDGSNRLRCPEDFVSHYIVH